VKRGIDLKMATAKKKEPQLEQITKKEFDELFKESIINIEEQLFNLTTQYTDLLTFRQQYRIDYKSHRLIHQIKGDILTYIKHIPRKIGYLANKDRGQSE